MKQKSEQLVNTCEYEVEDGTSLKFVFWHKAHRKIVSGLRLLTDSCPTIGPSTDVSTSEGKVGEEDDHQDTHKQQSELPNDVLMHQIFARLPIKFLLKSKLVSKEWYSTLSSNEFANVHYKTHLSCLCPSSPIECLFIKAASTYYLLYLRKEEIVLDYCIVKLEPNFDDDHKQNELCLVGSCNGLVCLSDPLNDCFYIWNPIVYHCKKFSDPCLFSYDYCTSWGFGYASSINDYMVVRIAEKYDTQEVIVRVFSLKTKEWKQVHDHGLDCHRVSLAKTSPGVLVNDTLFWIMKTKDVTKNNVIIVGFNLTLEKFEEIPSLIPRSSTTTFQDHLLCVMGGCLSLCSSNLHKEACLSIMKQPGKVESVSFASYSDSLLCASLVGFTKTGKTFVVSKSWEVALVDLKSSPIQYFPLVNFEDARRPHIVSYFPSLISPSMV